MNASGREEFVQTLGDPELDRAQTLHSWVR